MARVDSPVPLMHHDSYRSWITDPHPDHPQRNANTAVVFDLALRVYYVSLDAGELTPFAFVYF